jgi:hypothetical protein
VKFKLDENLSQSLAVALASYGIRAALDGLLAHNDLEDLQGCLVIVQLGAVRIRR